MTKGRATRNGFSRTGKLLAGQLRAVSQSRGFEKSKILTHWEDIVGPDTAAMCRPTEISYGRGGLGATLVLLTTGANAPVLQMEKEKIRERVNAVYGYPAISKVRVTQTASHGFSEGKIDFALKPKAQPAAEPQPETIRSAQRATADVGNDDLRAALARLGTNIIEKEKKGPQK
ncbi:MAG: DUF721 domain-containing protein [Rhodobacteraceae bacterium]|nr:DUF721 domain-containing protein [Paracoccaceae bacterium]